MKILIDQSALKKAISTVIGSSAVKGKLPIFQNIKIDASGGKLNLSATDMETATNNSCEALVSDDGSITVPAATFFDIVKKLPSESKIGIEVVDQTLLIKCGRSKYKLPTMSAEDFPSFSESKFGAEFEISSKDLINLIDKTRFAISSDETRYYLNGLCLNSVESDGQFKINAVSTDGTRLGLSTINSDINLEFSVILPKKTVGDIRKLAAECNLAKIRISKRIIKIEFGSITYSSKLIDGEFPDYRRVIPTNNDQLVIVNKQSLFQCLDRISTVAASDKHNSIKLIFENNKLVLTALGGSEELDINYQGDKIEIGFNAKFLMDLISHVDEESVEMFLSKNSAPALVKSLNSQFILMPTRI
tara:strand:- start:38669 stop:39751 length:1083 start_codon:yes stop_codon:yes gene_type:complete